MLAVGGKPFQIKGIFRPIGISIQDPASVKHVMNDNFDNYVKGEQFNAIMGDLLGEGIFTTDGPKWYVQRKVAAHLFKRAELEGYMTKSVVLLMLISR